MDNTQILQQITNTLENGGANTAAELRAILTLILKQDAIEGAGNEISFLSPVATIFGKGAALTGNIVIDAENGLLGGLAIIRHNDTTKPLFSAKSGQTIAITSQVDYLPSVDNWLAVKLIGKTPNSAIVYNLSNARENIEKYLDPVQDNQLITALASAVFNDHLATLTVDPAWRAGREYADANYKYEALADNTILRIALSGSGAVEAYHPKKKWTRWTDPADPSVVIAANTGVPVDNWVTGGNDSANPAAPFLVQGDPAAGNGMRYRDDDGKYFLATGNDNSWELKYALDDPAGSAGNKLDAPETGPYALGLILQKNATSGNQTANGHTGGNRGFKLQSNDINIADPVASYPPTDPATTSGGESISHPKFSGFVDGQKYLIVVCRAADGINRLWIANLADGRIYEIGLTAWRSTFQSMNPANLVWKLAAGNRMYGSGFLNGTITSSDVKDLRDYAMTIKGA